MKYITLCNSLRNPQKFTSELCHLKVADCSIYILYGCCATITKKKNKYKRHQNKSRKTDGEKRNFNRNLQEVLFLASISCTKVIHEQRPCQTDKVLCIATLWFNTLFIACLKVKGLTSILPGLLHSHLQCHIRVILYVVCFNRKHQVCFSISSLSA